MGQQLKILGWFLIVIFKIIFVNNITKVFTFSRGLKSNILKDSRALCIYFIADVNVVVNVHILGHIANFIINLLKLLDVLNITDLSNSIIILLKLLDGFNTTDLCNIINLSFEYLRFSIHFANTNIVDTSEWLLYLESLRGYILIICVLFFS